MKTQTMSIFAYRNMEFLSFIKSPDYENPVDFRLNNTYEIRILAVDSGIPRNQGRLQVRIEIKQVNELRGCLGCK